MVVTPLLGARDRGHDAAPRNPCARSVIRRTSSGESVTSAAGASIDPHHNRRPRHSPALRRNAYSPVARPGCIGGHGGAAGGTLALAGLYPSVLVPTDAAQQLPPATHR